MNDHVSRPFSEDVVGIVPMAGTASRLGELACSKEIHPVKPAVGEHGTDGSPRAVCEHLLEKMHAAGVNRVYVILRQGKWDIPAYLGDGSRNGLHLAYLMMGLPYGTPYSIDQAYPFSQHAIVAFGFPDMVLAPGDIFKTLLEYRKSADADVVLGLFPADRSDKVDMVDVDSNGKVKQITLKPGHTHLRFTWGVAVWTPTFSRFLHEFLAAHQKIAATEPEIFLGDIVQAGIDNGLNIHAIQVSAHPFLDIGTTDDLRRATIPPEGN